MRVDVSRDERRFVYRLEPDADDPRETPLSAAGLADPLRLVGDRWEVHLPPEFTEIHPDLHAAAIWLTLEPFVGARLTLPFGVSPAWAAHAAAGAGVAFPNVDPTLEPRRQPPGHRAGLLFSGGFDSLTASLLLPDDAVCLQTTRIPRDAGDWPGALREVEAHMATKALLRERVAATGRRVIPLFEDHEALFRPYPRWHSGAHCAQLPALYLADSLGLAVVEWGDILGNILDLAFRFDRPAEWRFDRARRRCESTPEEAAAAVYGTRFGERGELALLGLTKGSSIAALSTVATALVVHRSVHRGEALPCDYAYPNDLPTWGIEPVALYCMRCDRCFQKLLLHHVFRDEPMPARLVDHFLRFPDLAAIFSRPVLDWHHVWLYAFQRVRCDHPFVRALQRQARAAPDLALFEKWCPLVEGLVPQQPYAAAVRARALGYVAEMTDDEQAALPELRLPPLDLSELQPFLADGAARAADAADRAGAAAAPPGRAPRPEGLRERPGTLALRFRDAAGRLPDHVFYLGPARDGDPLFRRHGAVGVAHEACPHTKAFDVLARFVDAAAGALPHPEAPREPALLRAFQRTRLPMRFHLEVTPVGGEGQGQSTKA
jgi:hypothetical protein